MHRLLAPEDQKVLTRFKDELVIFTVLIEQYELHQKQIDINSSLNFLFHSNFLVTSTAVFF